MLMIYPINSKMIPALKAVTGMLFCTENPWLLSKKIYTNGL